MRKKKKIIIAVILILILISLNAFGLWVKNTSSFAPKPKIVKNHKKDWNLYQARWNNFQLLYPANWILSECQVNEDCERKSGASIYSEKYTPEKFHTMTGIQIDFMTYNSNLNYCFQKINLETTEFRDWAKLPIKKRTIISNSPAVIFEGERYRNQLANDYTLLKRKEIFIVHNDLCYQFFVEYQDDTGKKILEDIVNSFQFIDNKK